MRINNRVLYIESQGPQDGHPVILLHHGLGSTEAWRKQVPVLTAAGYRVIAYDRWGYGRSEPRSHLAVPGFEDDLIDLEALLAMFGFGHMTLIGHSDGGSIALYYALQHPEQVHALVTVAAHIYLESEMEPGIRGIRQAFEKDQRLRKGMLRVHGEKFESTFFNWFDGWHTPEILAWDMRRVLSNIQCPTLVIQGEGDEYASPQHAIDIAENIPGAKLWLVPGGKHMLPQEMADEFNRKVISFLEDVKG